MRLMPGLLALSALCAVPQPAWSQAEIHQQSLSVDPQPIDPGMDTARPGLRIVSGVRLGIELPAVTDQGLLGGPGYALQQRVASSMVDFYPDGGQRFHLSAGLGFFTRTRFMREQERATNGLLFVPRTLANGGGRSIFRRYTPAVMLGFSRQAERGAVFNLEAGTMLGRATNAFNIGRTRMTRFGDGSVPINPIVHMVVGYKF